MTALPALASRTFAARVQRVRSWRRLEVVFDLDFGVSVAKTLILAGLEDLDLDEAVRARARHCLVILCGGKRVLVRPDPRTRTRWGELQEIPVRVYLLDPVRGRPVGYIEALPDAEGVPALEIGPYMRGLVPCGFDNTLVISLLSKVAN